MKGMNNEELKQAEARSWKSLCAKLRSPNMTEYYMAATEGSYIKKILWTDAGIRTCSTTTLWSSRRCQTVGRKNNKIGSILM